MTERGWYIPHVSRLKEDKMQAACKQHARCFGSLGLYMYILPPLVEGIPL